MNDTAGAIAIAIAAALLLMLIWLATRRWFWVMVFWIAGLASLFSLLASIIHFQIIGALFFFFAMLICFGIGSAIAEGGQSSARDQTVDGGHG